jgi:hypothetical protein
VTIGLLSAVLGLSLGNQDLMEFAFPHEVVQREICSRYWITNSGTFIVKEDEVGQWVKEALGKAGMLAPILEGPCFVSVQVTSNLPKDNPASPWVAHISFSARKWTNFSQNPREVTVITEHGALLEGKDKEKLKRRIHDYLESSIAELRRK